jgi:hypothetical protein
MDYLWWVAVAFVGGGSLGMLTMALMNMAGGLPEPDPRVDDGSVNPEMWGPTTEF